MQINRPQPPLEPPPKKYRPYPNDNAAKAKQELSSHPGELPLEMLTKPYVSLSRHTALVNQPLRDRESASEQTNAEIRWQEED